MLRLLHHSANLAFAIFLFLADQPFSRAEPMIGQNMEVAKLPFVASLSAKRFKFGPDKAQFCLGSLIAPNLVLTAAHCLEMPNYEDVEVVIGARDLRAVAKPKHSVHSWTTLAKWAATKSPRMKRLRFQDMAIVTLRRPVVGVTPASITKLKTADLHGRNATIIGWAAGLDGGRRFLKQAKVRILTTADCEKRFELLTGFFIPVPEGTLCSAADPFVLSTRRDSGGPLLDENNNILGLTTGICPEYASDCTEGFADRLRFNFHMDFIDEFRQFVDEMKALYPSKHEFIKIDV